jgi:hypothetical protein
MPRVVAVKDKGYRSAPYQRTTMLKQLFSVWKEQIREMLFVLLICLPLIVFLAIMLGVTFYMWSR